MRKHLKDSWKIELKLINWQLYKCWNKKKYVLLNVLTRWRNFSPAEKSYAKLHRNLQNKGRSHFLWLSLHISLNSNIILNCTWCMYLICIYYVDVGREFLNLIEQEIPVWKLLGPKNSVPKCSEWKQTFCMESIAALWRRRGVHRTKTQTESNLFRKPGTSIIPFRHSGLALLLKLFLFLHE